MSYHEIYLKIEEKKKKKSFFKEPIRYDYINIDKHNKMHLLAPVVRHGNNIGTDNTCKAYLEIKKFLNTVKSNLKTYKKNLTSDIKQIKSYLQSKDTLYPIHTLKKMLSRKQKRLEQIESYQKLLEKKLSEIKINDLFNVRFFGMITRDDKYPAFIRKLLRKRTNCYAMSLCPNKADFNVHFPNPIFSLNRIGRPMWLVKTLYFLANCWYAIRSMKPEQIKERMEKLRLTFLSYTGSLEHHLSKIKIVFNKNQYKQENPKDYILSEVEKWANKENKKFTGEEKHDNKLIKEIQQFVKEKIQKEYRYKNEIDLTYVQPKFQPEKNNQHQVAKFATTQDYSSIMKVEIDKNTTVNDFVTMNFSASLDEHFWETLTPPHIFKQSKDIKTLSVMVQFFLAEINIYCHEHDISKKNFGQTLEQTWRSATIANSIQKAWKNNDDIESCLFKLINSFIFRLILGLKRKLNQKDKNEIKKRFSAHWNTIKESPHFDEFLIFMEDKKGDFVSHRNRISMHFYDMIINLGKKNSNKHLERIKLNRQYFKQIEGKRLNHINEMVKNDHEQFKNQKKEIKKLLTKKECDCKKLADLLFEKRNGVFDIADWPTNQFNLLQKKLGIDKFIKLLQHLKVNANFVETKNFENQNVKNKILSSLKQNGSVNKPCYNNQSFHSINHENFKDLISRIEKITINYHAVRNSTWRQMIDIRYFIGYWFRGTDSSTEIRRKKQVKKLEEKIKELSKFKSIAQYYSTSVLIEKLVDIIKYLQKLEKKIQQKEYRGFFRKHFKPKSELLRQIQRALSFFEKDPYCLTQKKIKSLGSINDKNNSKNKNGVISFPHKKTPKKEKKKSKEIVTIDDFFKKFNHKKQQKKNDPIKPNLSINNLTLK